MSQKSCLGCRAKCSASGGKMGWNVVTALEARKKRGLQVA